MSHSRPRFVVVSGNHQLDKIERGRHRSVEKFYVMDFNAESVAWGTSDFGALTAGGGATPERLQQRIDAALPDDLCMVMYTSGTTGPPKGVKLSHRNLISQQKALSLIWNVDDKDVLMSYLPWHHSFGGLFERFLTLYNGCELCLDDSRGRDIDRLIENWKTFDPTMFLSVPRVHDQLVARCCAASGAHGRPVDRRAPRGATLGGDRPSRPCAMERPGRTQQSRSAREQRQSMAYRLTRSSSM